MKIEITSGFVLGVGRSAHVGEVLDLPPQEAARWIRLKYAKPYQATPAGPPTAPPDAAGGEGELYTQPVDVTHDDPRPHSGRGSRRTHA